MLSKLKTYLNMCIHPRLKYMPISLKLAFIYSIMLCLIFNCNFKQYLDWHTLRSLSRS